MRQLAMGNFDSAKRLPSAKFLNLQDSVSGVILTIDPLASVPEFDDKGNVTGNKVGEDGKDLTQVDVTLDTETGKIVLHTGGGVFWAIGRALAEIGADDIEPGNTLTVTYVSDRAPSGKGRTGAKQYVAKIVV